MTQRSPTLRSSSRTQGDLLRVLRPDDADRRDAEVLAVLLVLLELLLVLVVEVAGVAVMLLAVGRQLDLLDGLVVGLLLGQLEALRVHHEQVVAAAEDDGLLVGRDGGPAGPLERLLVVLEEGELPGRELVGEGEDLGLLLGLLGLLGLLLLVLLGVLELLLLLLLVLVLDLASSLAISAAFTILPSTRTSASLGTSISNWMAVSFLMNLIVRIGRCWAS